MVKNAENYFRITRGIIDPVKTSAALSQMPLDKTQGEEPPVPSGPGDIPMFLLHANKSFIRWGETVEYRLMPLQEITQKLYVHGRVYRPGLNGHYDGTYPVTYFGGETGNGAGAIYPGPRPGDFFIGMMPG